MIVGQGLDSNSFSTIELSEVVVKRFQMFQLIADPAASPFPNSSALCKLDQLIPFPHFFQWVGEAFPVPSVEAIPMLVKTKDNVKLELKAVDIRDGKVLSIQIGNNEQQSSCKV